MRDATTDAERTDPERPDAPVRLSSGEALDALVAARDLVLVDFYTSGCTLCQSIEPVLGNVARATDATVALINPRDDLSLVKRFEIRSVPTLVLFEGGEPVGRVAEGFVGTGALVEFVETRGRSE
jgi:thiol-disulfide isomerase/thioredoxin